MTGRNVNLLNRYLGYEERGSHRINAARRLNFSTELNILIISDLLSQLKMSKYTLLLIIASSCYLSINAFSLEMMGGRRGKGNLKRSLDPSALGDKRVKAASGVASL
jgi:hypothetical protein